MLSLKKGNRLRLTVLIVTLLLAATVGYLYWSWNRALTEEAITFTLSPGQSLRGFARQLAAKKIIRNKLAFIVLAKFKGVGRKLHAGEYRLQPGMSMRDLLERVVGGKVIQYSLVLLEGWTFDQFLHTIQQAPKLKPTLKDLNHAQIMQRLGHVGEHPEGRFYPDTYTYTAGMTDVQILKQAYRRMQQRLQRAWQGRDADLPIKTPYEALILASIIEKETGKREERHLIAAVFINRLRRNMRLQTDPTVIYGLGKAFDGNLRRRDLRRDTPYNTYTRRGLPPTPIAMPGEESIRAAVHPADSRVLYFVSKGDGSHHFSKTLAEHNRAVIKFQIKRRPPASSSRKPKSANTHGQKK